MVQRMINDWDDVKDGGGGDHFDNSLFQSFNETLPETYRNSLKKETYSEEEECKPRNYKRIVLDTFRNAEETPPKRIKLCSQLNPQGGEVNFCEEKGSPLGLKLKKTPSFTNLVEMKLPEAKYITSNNNQNSPKNLDDFVSQQQTSRGKLKASNFGASKLKIGSWEMISRREGDLVAKCYYSKRRFVWEILEGALKSKIEIQWSDIVGIRATNIGENEHGMLEIELKQPPLFFREINPQPKKHTLWQQASDFTNGQASICRIHSAIFPPGILHKHYEKILQSDERLFMLSKKPFPSEKFPYFDQNTCSPTPFSFDFTQNSPQFSSRYGAPIPNFLTIPHQQYLPNINGPTRSPMSDFLRIDERENSHNFPNQRTTLPDYCVFDYGEELTSCNSNNIEILGDINDIENEFSNNYGCMNTQHLEAIPSNNYYGMNIQQLEANPCNFSYNEVNIPHSTIQQLEANPCNYNYNGVNITNSNGGPTYANPVSWFQLPQDSDENNTITNIQDNELYRAFVDFNDTLEIPHWE